MEKNEIFKLAMLDYNSELGEIRDTPFSVIEGIIRGINLSNLDEEEKINKLENMFVQITMGKEKRFMGVQRKDLSQIINVVFKLKNGKISNSHLYYMNMDEIFYYYCYISKMAKSKIRYSPDEIHKVQQEVSKIMENQKEKITAEEEARKEAIRKREEEKKLQEEAEKKAEEERIANMSELEKILEEIKNDNREENYVKLFDSLAEFEDTDKVLGAKILKEHWMAMENKWNGKLSKKQIIKVKKIKEILGE